MPTILFDVLAILYAFRSVQIGLLVWRNWAEIKSDSFTPQLKSLAAQASFFLAVPVGVFFHELAHALATWLFGGQVVEFGYRVFWGFVLPAGEFNAAQLWFIALAGTLGSLAFGSILWLTLSRHHSTTIRYFALRAFRYQIFFSLVYYPVFTLLGFYGDWRTIYDFNATPVLSGTTLAIHVVLLGLFLWADRRGAFEMPSFRSPSEQQRYTSLETQVEANPQDVGLQLRLIEAYRQGGLDKKAQQQLRTFLKVHPDSAEGYLQQALLLAQNKRQVPVRARNSAEKALSLGLSDPAGVAYADQIIGEYSLGVGRLDEAIARFNQGIAAAQKANRPGIDAHLNYLRAVAYRRKGQYQNAYHDIEQAIKLARQAGGPGQAVAQYQSELETIESHAGRSLGPRTGGIPHDN